MLNVVLFERILGEDGVTRDEVGKGGSSTTSSLDSRGEKDAPSSHKEKQTNIKFRRTKPKVGLM